MKFKRILSLFLATALLLTGIGFDESLSLDMWKDMQFFASTSNRDQAQDQLDDIKDQMSDWEDSISSLEDQMSNKAKEISDLLADKAIIEGEIKTIVNIRIFIPLLMIDGRCHHAMLHR